MTDTPLTQRVAAEVRVRLARLNISAAELARRTGLKQPYLSRRMTCEVAFDLDDLQLIANALHVQVVDLLPQPARQDGRGQTGQVSDRIAYRPQGPDPTRPPAGRPPNHPMASTRTADTDSRNAVTSRTRTGRPTVHPHRIGGVKS
jgi:transcriptional regulator with XRE-family HTH domain